MSIPFSPYPGQWTKAFKEATPGMSADQRVDLSRQLYFDMHLPVSGPSGGSILNPHQGGVELQRIADTIKRMGVVTILSPSALDHAEQSALLPRVVVDKPDDRKTIDDELIHRIFELKGKRDYMLLRVAELSLDIAKLDVQVGKATFKNYVDRKTSRENDHG